MTDRLVRFNPSYARPFLISLRALDNSTTKEVIEQLRKDCAQALADYDAQHWHVEHRGPGDIAIVFGTTHELQAGTVELEGQKFFWWSPEAAQLMCDHLNATNFKPAKVEDDE